MEDILDLEPEAPTEPAPVKSENTATLQAQKEHWRAKAEKLEAENAALKAQPKPVETPPSSNSVGLDDIFSLEGYSKPEKELIVRESKAKNITISKAVEDESIKLALEGLKAKLAREAAALPPSGPSGSVTNASFEAIGKMSREEHMKLEKEVLAKRGNNF